MVTNYKLISGLERVLPERVRLMPQIRKSKRYLFSFVCAVLFAACLQVITPSVASSFGEIGIANTSLQVEPYSESVTRLSQSGNEVTLRKANEGLSSEAHHGSAASQVAVGETFSCAIIPGGLVKCWGENISGQLGQGDTINRGDNSGEMGDNLPPVDLGHMEDFPVSPFSL